MWCSSRASWSSHSLNASLLALAVSSGLGLMKTMGASGFPNPTWGRRSGCASRAHGLSARSDSAIAHPCNRLRASEPKNCRYCWPLLTLMETTRGNGRSLRPSHRVRRRKLIFHQWHRSRPSTSRSSGVASTPMGRSPTCSTSGSPGSTWRDMCRVRRSSRWANWSSGFPRCREIARCSPSAIAANAAWRRRAISSNSVTPPSETSTAVQPRGSNAAIRPKVHPPAEAVSRRATATDSCQNRLLDFGSEPNHHDDDQPSLSRPGGVAVSVLELVLVIMLLAVLVALVAVVIRRPSATGPSDAVLAALADLGSLKSHVETVSNQQGALSQSLGMLQAAVQGVETKVLESSAGVREAIGKDLSDARIVVERLKVDGEERRRMEEDVQASARRIETVLLGSRTRGAAGENILQDAFRQFPAEMIDMNFRVNGKVVEYALILATGKPLPIDSKWPSPELLDRLGEAMQDPTKEAAVVQEIERILRLKVRDVRQYIDPAATIGFALAAGPAPVFNACRRAHLEAYREGVILMPYSMTIPYVLALFRLHLQYARSIDLENLEGHLQQIDDNVTALDRLLENSIARGSTMIQNAFNDAKRNVGQMRGALAALRAVPEVSVSPEPEVEDIDEGDLALLMARR